MQWNLLLVDDEVGILQAIRRMLRPEQYTLFEASNTAEALEILHEQDIHLLITDFKMPGGDGLSLCRQVRQTSPATYRILLSGQVDYPELQQAWRDGDVHRFVAKPWDNLLLTSDIKEGLKQHQLLRKAQLLRHTVQDEQPLLLTDVNWIVRLVNRPMCEALGLNEQELIGKNLFAPNISAMPVELETEVTLQVEADHSWLGFFNFLQKDQQKVPSWMTVTSVSDQFRVCLCRFVGDDISPPSDFKDELKRYSGSHHLNRLERDAHDSDDTLELLVVSFDPQQVDNKDLSSICYERLQAATNEQFEIYSPQLHVFLILVPAREGIAVAQQQHISDDFKDPIKFRGERLIVQPGVVIEQKRDDSLDWDEWLRQRLGLIPEAMQQEPQKPALRLSEAAKATSPSKAEHQALLLFSQRGELVALKPTTKSHDTEHWHDWLTTMNTAWKASYPGHMTVIYDAQDVPLQHCRAYLNAIQSFSKEHDLRSVVILDENQLLCQDSDEQTLRSELHQTNCQLFMANFGRSFLNSRQVLSLPIQGVMLAPEFLSNMRHSKSLPQSRRLLQRIHDHDLLIYAPEINITESLAAAHQSNVDWLSGDVLSRPLSADQLHWFAQ